MAGQFMNVWLPQQWTPQPSWGKFMGTQLLTKQQPEATSDNFFDFESLWSSIAWWIKQVWWWLLSSIESTIGMWWDAGAWLGRKTSELLWASPEQLERGEASRFDPHMFSKWFVPEEERNLLFKWAELGWNIAQVIANPYKLSQLWAKAITKFWWKELLAKTAQLWEKWTFWQKALIWWIKSVPETTEFALQSEWRLPTATELWVWWFLWAAWTALWMTPKALQQSNVDDATKTVLKNTKPEELQSYLDITKASKLSDEVPTAYNVASSKVDDALSKIEWMRSEVGSKIWAVRTNLWDVKATLGDFESKFWSTLEKYWFKLKPWQAWWRFTGKLSLKDTKRISALPPDERNLLNSVVETYNKIRKKPSLWDFQLLRDNLISNFWKIENKSNTIKSIFTQAKQHVDDVMNNITPQAYKWDMKKYSELSNLIDRITTGVGKEWQRGETLVRSLFGARSQIARDLFGEIKKITGVDLFKESRLAKFAMESMWDTRWLQQMLENLNVKQWAKWLLEKAGSPIKGAKDIVNKKVNLLSPKAEGRIQKTRLGVQWLLNESSE